MNEPSARQRRRVMRALLRRGEGAHPYVHMDRQNFLQLKPMVLYVRYALHQLGTVERDRREWDKINEGMKRGVTLHADPYGTAGDPRTAAMAKAARDEGLLPE